MLRLSKQLFEKWNQSVSYCHWKSNEHLMEGLEGTTDLDVLLCDRDKEKGEAVLVELGFFQCKSQYGSRYPGVDDWLGFDKQTGRMIHIHLHYLLVTGHKGLKEYQLPWTGDALSNRAVHRETGIYVMNPNLEIVTLYCRISLKATWKQIKNAKAGKFSIGKDNYLEIRYLKEIVEWNEVYKNLLCYFKQDADSLLSLMKNENITSQDFLKLQKYFTNECCSYSRYRGLSLFIRKWYYIVIMRLLGWLKYKLNYNLILRKVPKKGKGLTIAFLGQDGAGKSTVTRDIEKWLTWKLDAKRFYLGSGDHFNPWQKKLQAYFHSKTNPIAQLFRSWLPFSLLSSLARKTNKTICTAKRYAGKGGIAIFDRYPQTDYMGINDGPKIRTMLMPSIHSSLLKKIAAFYACKEEKELKKAAAHEPDVVIKLMLSPEESIRRKPHENYEAVKQKHEVIKNLKFEGAAVYEIDAMQDYEQELIQIKSVIWQHIQK